MPFSTKKASYIYFVLQGSVSCTVQYLIAIAFRLLAASAKTRSLKKDDKNTTTTNYSSEATATLPETGQSTSSDFKNSSGCPRGAEDNPQFHT